jgi:hypothetical protein
VLERCSVSVELGKKTGNPAASNPTDGQS